MLWNVRGTDVFILGSVHKADRPLTLSSAAMAALGAAATVAFESNSEFEVERGLTHYMPMDALSKHIPAELFAETRRAWDERGLLTAELERLKPVTVAIRLSEFDESKRGFEPGFGLERSVLAFAKRERKKLYFLESASDGFAPLAKAPAGEVEALLARTVSDPEDALRETATLVNAWVSDDLDAIAAVGARAYSQMPTSFTASIAGRNKAWMKPLTRLILAKKGAVIVVGALHMVGKDSLPELLFRAGHECIWLGNKS